MSSETTVQRLKALMWQARCTAWSDGISAVELAEPGARWRQKLHQYPGAGWDDPSDCWEDDGQFCKRYGLAPRTGSHPGTGSHRRG